jgi:hypothetical protein
MLSTSFFVMCGFQMQAIMLLFLDMIRVLSALVVDPPAKFMGWFIFLFNLFGVYLHPKLNLALLRNRAKHLGNK